MAIARAMNPFTCFRDLRELNDLIDARGSLMSAIEDARTYRAECRHIKKYKADYLPASIYEHYKRNYEQAMQLVRKKYEEYFYRCQFAGMNIITATAFREKLIEYIDEL